MTDIPATKPPEWWPTHYPRLWPLLNSSIGLWFLSSIVLGGLGALYTQNQNQRNEALKKLELANVEETKNKVLIEKLDLEIGYRLSTAISQLSDIDSQIQRCRQNTKLIARCKATQDSLSSIFTSRAQQPTMFPEFSMYSTLALVAELKRLAPTDEQERLKQVIFDMSGTFTMLDVAKASLDQPKLVAGTIVEKLVLPRWQQGFYYLDCSKTEPFC